MHIIAWLIGLPLAVAIVLFALSNRGTVTLGFWPFEPTVTVSLYVAVLVPLLIGVAFGWLIGLPRAMRNGSRSRAQSRRIAELEQELVRQKQFGGQPPQTERAPEPAVLPGALPPS